MNRFITGLLERLTFGAQVCILTWVRAGNVTDFPIDLPALGACIVGGGAAVNSM